MAVVALIGPAPEQSHLAVAFDQFEHVVVPIAIAPEVEGQLGPAIAALACDLVIVEIDARIGLNRPVVDLWRWVEQAQMPRVIVVSGIGGERADFDDLTTLAQHLLEAEALATRLPVFDDDHHAVASLNLTNLVIHSALGIHPSESGHQQVVGGARSELLAALATVVTDDEHAMRLLGAAARVGQEPDDAGVVSLPMPVVGVPNGGAGVPNDPVWDVSTALADAVAHGAIVPILAATAENAWCTDIDHWVTSISADAAQRLVLRNEAGEPVSAAASVVLHSQGRQVLVRTLQGTPREGSAMLTAPGLGRDQTPEPFRAWPTHVTELQHLGAGCWHLRSEIQAEAGDALVGSHTWVQPLPLF